MKVRANGKREILEVKITTESLEKEDLEMLEDMILIAVNDVMKQIEKETENKLGRYTQGMPGLF